jgi:hypothetical protein
VVSLARLLHWLCDFFTAPRSATFHAEVEEGAQGAAAEEAEAWALVAVLSGAEGPDAALELFDSLQPSGADWQRLVDDRYARPLARVDGKMWESYQYELAVPSFGTAEPLPLVWSATRAELQREAARLRRRDATTFQLEGAPPQPSAAISHFPRQWLVLAPMLKKGVRVHCFKYAPPAELFLEDGLVYDGLCRLPDGGWRLFLRPWHHLAMLPTAEQMAQVRESRSQRARG